jgi:hypothetical protein
MADAAKKVEEKKPVQGITRIRFSTADAKRNIFQALCAPEATLEDVLEPSYFNNVISDIKAFDRIECLSETGAWWAELLVVYKMGGQMRLAVLRELTIEQPELPTTKLDNFEINWGGPAHKYRVINTKTKKVIKMGFGTRDEALAWTQQHIRNLGK